MTSLQRFHPYFLPSVLLLFLATAYAFILEGYPHLLEQVEHDAFYLSTKEFLSSVLTRPDGVTQLLTCWLQQFYFSAWTGAGVFFLLLSFVLFLSFRMLRAFSSQASAWPTLLFVPFALACWFPDVSGILHAAVISALCWGFVRMPSAQWRVAWAWCLTPITFLLLPTATLFFLVLLYSLLETLSPRGGQKTAWAVLLSLAEVWLMPLLWNEWVAFVPFSTRLTPALLLSQSLTTYALWGVFLVIVLTGHFLRRRWEQWGFTAVAILSITALVMLLSNRNLRYKEKCLHLSALSDKGAWQELKEVLSYEDCFASPLWLNYMLLAESELGTLPETLFGYPVRGTEAFHPVHPKTRSELTFNRQWYACLGVPDEAFHLSFEYGVKEREGLCLGSLREMTDYALQSGEYAVAKKYLYLLRHTTCHTSWLAARERRLHALKGTPPRERAPRTDVFIGGYPFNSEMVRLAEYEPQNKKALDFLLLGLLLKKDVNKFRLALTHFSFYQGKTLPRAYQEALALLAPSCPQLRTLFVWDDDCERRYLEFEKAMRQGGDTSPFAGTYWYYLAYAQVDEESVEGAASH